MGHALLRPPFDPELVPSMSALADRPGLTLDTLEHLRSITRGEPLAAQLGDEIEVEEVVVPGHEGAPIALTIVRPREQRRPAPLIYSIHGGGMVMGDRNMGLWMYRDVLASLGATVISVEYRLAPEFPDPTPVQDCFAGLDWALSDPARLGIDPARVLLAGMSAGGGLAAGVALLRRDLGRPPVRGLLLSSPMLDDRPSDTDAQFDDSDAWSPAANRVAWATLLGDREPPSVYAAPARADDLSGLPAAYLDCGSAELFREHGVEFARRIWLAGGAAELHIWPGGFHGFERYAPAAAVSRAAYATRTAWIERILSSRVDPSDN